MRAARIPFNENDKNPIFVQDSKFVDAILNLCIYRSPIELSGLPPLQFCRYDLFWASCLCLVVVACFNPSTIGLYVWQKIPTLKLLMQMLISHSFQFPLFFFSTESLNLESQILNEEREQIILFENKLASKYSTTPVHIDETNAQFLSTFRLMRYNPEGEKRKPSQALLSKLQDVKVFQNFIFFVFTK